MELLTPTGYKNINDVNIGDELIAYDINTGAVIINNLLGKELWTNDMLEANPPMYESVYNEETQEYEDVLVYAGMTSEEVFQETHGDWKFFEINGTWKLFVNQSIWANLKVVHVSDLQVGDIVYDDDDNDVVITSIVECVEPSWWRLVVSNDHSYIANNLQLHNASRYWSGNMTPTSFNWNYTTGGTNWGSASGVADNATVPVSTDDVTFDGVGVKGNANSIVSATITVLSYTVTAGYTATMTINAILTIAENITLGANYTLAGTSGILSTATCTITSNGKVWNLGFSMSNTVTRTLVGNFTITSSFAHNNGSTATFNKTTTEELILSNIFPTSAVFTMLGTATIRITGGVINVVNGTLGGTTVLNGNIVLTFCFVQGNFSYQSGAITGARNIRINANAALNTNGMSFVGVTVDNNITVTLNSLLTATGTLLLNVVNTFAGTAGFTVGTLSKIAGTVANATLTLQNSVTYTVTSAIVSRNPNGSNSIISNDATLRANLILVNGATCNVSSNFTRINAIGGRTINSWNGVITDSINVRTFTDFQGVSTSSII